MVALSRLVYRKGVNLLNVVIPAVCRRQPHVDFIIGETGHNCRNYVENYIVPCCSGWLDPIMQLEKWCVSENSG